MPSERTTRRISSRGHQRRKLIINATIEILLRDGFAAVSHRAVAQHAHLPLSATTYYFDSLEDLLAQAVTELADTWLGAARTAVVALPESIEAGADLAHALVSVAVPSTDEAGHDSLVTFYDRYLEAARHPRLRPLVVRYDEHLDDLIADVLRRGGLDHSRSTARLVLAVVDGATVRALAEGSPLDDVAARVVHLVATLRPTGR